MLFRPLEEIFKEATKDEKLKPKKTAPVTEAEKAEAERLKLEGNEAMRAEKFDEAVQFYTKALEIDPSNQVFYCNRAAAHSKKSDFYAAVEDCRRAIDMDPTYGKAYGRMGLAYSSVEKHKEAVDCFKKAVELEPENESYRSNLQLATEKLEQARSNPAPSAPAGFPNLGGMDFSAMLSNPALMNMATTLMSDPNMQNMMGQMMAGGAGGGGVPGGMDGLIQAGQRLAEQMQSSNPELVEQLRRQVQGDDSNNENDQNQEPPSN